MKAAPDASILTATVKEALARLDALMNRLVEADQTGTGIDPLRIASELGRIRQLLASPMLLQGYGIAAADRASTRYSWERIARETLAVYERLRHVQLPAAAQAA